MIWYRPGGGLIDDVGMIRLLTAEMALDALKAQIKGRSAPTCDAGSYQ